jgi:hypothetical protein
MLNPFPAAAGFPFALATAMVALVSLPLPVVAARLITPGARKPAHDYFPSIAASCKRSPKLFGFPPAFCVSYM